MAVTTKNAILWMLCHVNLVRTDVSEERGASIIRVTTSNKRTLQQYFFAACVGCWLLLTLFLAHRF
jgi:hypothetical protein